MKRTKLQMGIYAIAATLLILGCNKQNMQQPPTKQLTTTTANLKTDATAVLLTDAEVVAQKFLQFKNPSTNITIKTAETVTKDGLPYLHIINASKGFVMLSADSIYPPLLAYDSLNNFDKGSINAGLAAWFNKHGEEMDFVRNTKNAYTDSIAQVNKTLWKAMGQAIVGKQDAKTNVVALPGDPPTLINTVPAYLTTNAVVPPLLHSHFTQGLGYNQNCPPGSYQGTGHTPAGCVPVAIAQVMGFWQYGTRTGSQYNWSIMPIHEPLGTNDAGYAEVSRLIYDIGTTPMNPALGGQLTNYADLNNDGSGGSTSDEDNIPYVFNTFQYSSATRTTESGVQGTAYATLIANEVANNQRPCILSGYPNQGSFIGIINWREGTGHTWVCDGSNVTNYYAGYTNTYSDGYGHLSYKTVYTTTITTTLLHMNWGLSGAITSPGGPNNDGWYNASVDYTANPANRVDYQAFQTVIYNIHP
jgi:hypothetical protein